MTQDNIPSVPGTLFGYLVRDIPVISEGDDIASMIEERFSLQDNDVVCIASTIVAKSEARIRPLENYTPTPLAYELGQKLSKDPRFVQAVMDESSEILIDDPFLLVVTRFGHTCINAGIDQSNVGGQNILLLPSNPMESAKEIHKKLHKDCAVIITDTCGRPFRCGVAGIAIGYAGIAALRDWRGEKDITGKALEITLEAIVDEIAGMANMMMGEAGGRTPCVVFRGIQYPPSGGTIFRPVEKDIIRKRLQ